MPRNILIVVDMQNDFINGALGTPEAQAIVADASAYICACREKGYTLIATLDTHGENYMDTAEGHKLPVPHCIKDTHGWQLNPDIAAALGDCILVEKPTFGSVALAQIVADLAGEDQPAIELMGLCTDICVASNALLLKAHFPEASIGVHACLCAGVTPDKHRAALETLQSCQIDML